MPYHHEAILVREVIEAMVIDPNGFYIDGTFGRGGHSQAILAKLGSSGQLLAFDKDPEAIAKAQTLQQDPRFCIVQHSFAHLLQIVEAKGWKHKVNGILLDLGVSSPQIDNPLRGFSFKKEGPLDMRMNPKEGISAAEWIAKASATEIQQILKQYGEERFAKRIAKAIVNEREKNAIKTTLQLRNIIAKAHPAWEKGKDPATQSFQAIRIYLNQELEDLEACLPQCLTALSIGGRMCVISFHSLEDRMVKQFIQRQVLGNDYPPDLPIPETELKRRMKKVGGLIRPTPIEIQHNPRARSARLRVGEKLL